MSHWKGKQCGEKLTALNSYYESRDSKGDIKIQVIFK